MKKAKILVQAVLCDCVCVICWPTYTLVEDYRTTMEVLASFTLFPSGNPSTPWGPGEGMVHGRMAETRNRVTRWSLGICPEGVSVPDTEAVIGDQLPTRRKLQSSVFRYANNYVWTNNHDSQMLDCKFPGVLPSLLNTSKPSLNFSRRYLLLFSQWINPVKKWMNVNTIKEWACKEGGWGRLEGMKTE